QLEGECEYEAERAVASDEELAEVVARDVFDDATARADDAPVGERDAHTEYVGTRRAVAMRLRAAQASRRHAAERRACPARRVEREPLPRAPDLPVEVRERQTSLDSRDEVCRLVRDDALHPRGLDDDAPAAHGIACVEPNARARGHDLPALARGDLQNLARLLSRCRRNDDSIHVTTRRAPAHLVRTASRQDVLIADDAGEQAARALNVKPAPRSRDPRREG